MDCVSSIRFFLRSPTWIPVTVRSMLRIARVLAQRSAGKTHAKGAKTSRGLSLAPNKSLGSFSSAHILSQCVKSSLQHRSRYYSSESTAETAEQEPAVAEAVPAWIDEVPIVDGVINYTSITPKMNDRGAYKFTSAIETAMTAHRIELFFHCRYYGHVPRETTFRFTIATARNLGRSKIALAIFEDALRSNSVKATVTLNTVLAAIAHDHPMEVLHDLLDRAKAKSIKADASTLQELLYCLRNSKADEKTLATQINALLKRFQDEGVIAGPECYAEVLDLYLERGLLAQALETYKLVVSLNLRPTILLAASFTRLHAMNRNAKEVNSIITTLPQIIPNLHQEELKWRPWDTAAEGYIWSNQANKLDSLIVAMQKANRTLPIALLRKVIKFYIQQDRIDYVDSLIKHAKRSLFGPTKRKRTDSALSVVAERFLQLRRVEELLDLATCSYHRSSYQPDFVHVMIDFFIAWRDESRLQRLNQYLVKYAPVEADEAEFLYSMKLNMHVGAFADVSALFDRMVESGFTPTAEHCNVVIESHLRAKSPKRAQEMFEEMRTNGLMPTTKTYSILMKHYAGNRSEAKVKELWDRMIADGLVPDASVYAQVMLVKFASSKWQEVLNNYEAMQIDGVQLNSECILHLVRTFGVLRQVDKAMQLVYSSLTSAESYQDMDALIAAAVVAAEGKRGADIHKILSMIVKSRPPSMSWPQVSLLADKVICKSLPPSHPSLATWKSFIKSSSLSLDINELPRFLEHLEQLLKEEKF